MKIPKLEPKMYYLGTFKQKIPNPLSYFKLTPCNLAIYKALQKKAKILEFATKTALFGHFFPIVLKNYYHILNQCP